MQGARTGSRGDCAAEQAQVPQEGFEGGLRPGVRGGPKDLPAAAGGLRLLQDCHARLSYDCARGRGSEWCDVCLHSPAGVQCRPGERPPTAQAAFHVLVLPHGSSMKHLKGPAMLVAEVV